MWSQADQHTMEVKLIDNYGWNVKEGNLVIDMGWDTTENVQTIQQRVKRLTQARMSSWIGCLGMTPIAMPVAIPVLKRSLKIK